MSTGNNTVAPECSIHLKSACDKISDVILHSAMMSSIEVGQGIEGNILQEINIFPDNKLVL